jgi:hypothetical protein
MPQASHQITAILSQATHHLFRLAEETTMLAPIFDCGKAIVRKGIHWLNQKLQQWSRPTDGRAVLETVIDLLRPKSELVLENALLRQQVFVLQRRAKRPNMTNLDRRLMVLLASRLGATPCWWSSPRPYCNGIGIFSGWSGTTNRKPRSVGPRWHPR